MIQPPKVSNAVQGARDAAHRANPVLEAMGRVGYGAKGVIYVIIGVLAVLAAVGAGGAATGQRGVIDRISNQPFGNALLYVLAFGLICYAVWRIVQAIANPEHRNVVKRIAYVVSGLAYGGLGVAAFNAANGAQAERSEASWAARVLESPFGQFGLFALAVIVGIGGFIQIMNAITAKFKSVLKTEEMSQDQLRSAVAAGRIGLFSRGIVFLIIAGFIFRAAMTANPRAAGGVDEALKALSMQTAGPVLLGAVALGLFAYGIYMFFEAKYRRMLPAA